MSEMRAPEDALGAPPAVLGEPSGAPGAAMVSVRTISIDTIPAVAVALSGRHGAGREMILDPADWQRLAAHGGQCRATLRPDGTFYIRHHELGQVARWILGVRPGDHVRHLNGDWLDLRRGNCGTPRTPWSIGRGAGDCCAESGG
jgi:hypothetical protein